MPTSETCESCGKLAHDGTDCLESKSGSSETSGHWPRSFRLAIWCLEECKGSLDRMSKYVEEAVKDDIEIKLLGILNVYRP